MLKFNADSEYVDLDREGLASVVQRVSGPPTRVDGHTIGIVTMTKSAPHGGELHPDGDEVLYVISGRVRLHLDSEPVQSEELVAGQGAVVPRGVWHRVEILAPTQLLHVTPGPGGEHKPLPR